MARSKDADNKATAKKIAKKAARRKTPIKAVETPVGAEDGPVVEDNAPFFLIEIFTDQNTTIKQKSPDGEVAQKFAQEVKAKGTYSYAIQNGIEVVGVEKVRVTGPYQEAPTPAEAGNDVEG